MHDAVGGLAGQSRRVRAADQQVPGVQAQRTAEPSRTRARRRGSRPPCRRAGAGRPAPHGRPRASTSRSRLSSSRFHATVVERGAVVVARPRRSPPPAPARRHRPRRTRRAPHRPPASGSCGRRAARPARTRRPPRGRGRPAPPPCSPGRRAGSRPARTPSRAGPRRASPRAPAPGELVAPARHLAHAPGDRRAGDAVLQRRAGSPADLVDQDRAVLVPRDSSQASAM